ncbi:condensation domain-containing protein, partial [Pseudomonas aeruginosa]
GEIEARLLEHPWVREAAVLAVDGRQLVGYVVLESESGDWREALAAHLAASLPEYMVPAQWLALERMPLSPNGKLDRKALPRPQAAAGQTHVAPQNEMERRIAAVWADVLKLEEVGATDNFFALGGDSIVSIQVVSRCRAAGIQFTPKDLFQQQTVQGLARVARVGAAVQMEQGPVSGETVLLPFQRLFFEQPIPNRQHWNQSLLLKPREALNAKALEAALQALVEHHDALRLRFHETDGTWHAEHAEATLGGALLWRAEAVDRQALESLCEESQRSLDLADGPLLRSLLVDMADGGQRLLLVIHHLVVDGVSWRILLEDLQRAYQQSLRGEAPRLPGKTSPFKAWAGRVSEHARGESMKAQLQFWRELLEGAPAELPCVHPQGALEQRFAISVQSRFDRSLTERLLKQAPAAYRTQVNDLLLTALARVVCRWSGASSSLVQLEGHGREELFADIDLSRTVGWFTSLFPVRLSPVADLGESLKAIKEQLRAIPDKGLGYGLLRYLAGEESARVLAGLPQARITFNYLGQFDAQFDEMALLDPAGESAGAEMDPGAPLDNWLSLNGRVFDGELSIDWSFSSQMFGEDQVRRLADDYVAELTALVDFCCDSPRHGATPSDFPLAGLDQARLDALPVALEEVEDIYPLSPMQQGMLFHSLYEQASSDYINQMRVDVSGLDIPRFRAAWQSALDRHAILRSGFAWQGELQQPLQIVYRQRQLPFAEEDLSQAANRDAALLALAAAERERGFELQRAPLLRLLLVKTAEGEHHLIYTHHHILLDGWSNAQLLSEVLESYAGRSPEQLRDGRYSDYIAWLQRQDAAATEAFWREQMAALDEPTRLVEALAQPGLTSANGVGEHLREVDATATARLRDFARRHQVTLNTLVQAGWALLLQRYTGQHTVVFGATVSGRPADLPGVENQVGLFINTLPVVVTLAPQMTLDELLQGLQRQNLALREQEHTPLFELQRWAGFGGEAVFDNLLVFENYPVDEVLERSSAGGVRFGAVAMHEQTNYPLALALGGGDSLSLQFSYDRGLFPAATIERLGRHLTTLLEAFAEHPQRRLVDLQMLEKAELSAIGAIWNRSDSGYPATPLVHQRVAERARMAPDAVAVIFDEEKLTYAELDSRANRLAHALIARGVGPEVRVAIAMQRSAEIMVAFLAVLKAGGAYVPLDIEYPRERLLYMMQDSRAHLLLTHSHLLERLPIPEGLSCLSVDREEEWAGFPAHDPEVALHGDNLAYVIYTSGSTGMPKGVAVSHGPLIAHIVATGERYEMTPEDCELHFMSFAFDGSHEGWMHPLINGARVLIRDDSLWLPERTYTEMHRHGVTVGVFPPVYLQQLAEHAARDGNPPPVRVYCFGGDAVAQASYDLAWRALKPKYLFNGYGPTETVVTPLLWK